MHAGLLACNEAAPCFREKAVDLDSIDRKLIKAELVRGAHRLHFMHTGRPQTWAEQRSACMLKL